MPSSALHVARTGLEAQDARMRVIANNLANVGTNGFKRDRANFATLAYQDARVAGQQSSTETAYATGLNLGTGVGVQSTTRIDTQGALNTTDNPLDMALDGAGYFQVQLPGGQLGYTRAGNFTRSAEGQLVTAQGYPVLPAITVPEGRNLDHRLARWHGIGAGCRQHRSAAARPDHHRRFRQSGADCRRRGTTSCWRPAPAARRSWARRAKAGAATSGRACSKARTSMSSRNWST